jgi:hypothetical protein
LPLDLFALNDVHPGYVFSPKVLSPLSLFALKHFRPRVCSVVLSSFALKHIRLGSVGPFAKNLNQFLPLFNLVFSIYKSCPQLLFVVNNNGLYRAQGHRANKLWGEPEFRRTEDSGS